MELHTVVTSDVLTTVSQSAIYNFTTCLTQIPTYLVLPVYYLISYQVKSTKFYNVCCCIDMTNDEQTWEKFNDNHTNTTLTVDIK